MEQEEQKVPTDAETAAVAEEARKRVAEREVERSKLAERLGAFDKELAELCKRHGIIAFVGAGQYDEKGSASVYQVTCDPWRAIGLGKLAQVVADRTFEKVK